MQADFEVIFPATTNGRLLVQPDVQCRIAELDPRPRKCEAGTSKVINDAGRSAVASGVACAEPDPGYVIAAWPGSGFATLGAVLSTAPASGPHSSYALSVTTTLSAPTFTEYHCVTINAVGGASTVEVAVDDGAPVSGPSITVYVKDGESLSVAKTADTGFQFVSEDPAPSPITADTTITVTFERPPSIDVDVPDTTNGTLSAPKAQITATPDVGYAVYTWRNTVIGMA